MDYLMSDGSRIHANSPKLVVRELRRMSHQPSVSDAAFMREMAARAKMASGDVIHTDNVDNFVNSLISTGFLKPVVDDNVKA